MTTLADDVLREATDFGGPHEKVPHGPITLGHFASLLAQAMEVCEGTDELKFTGLNWCLDAMELLAEREPTAAFNVILHCVMRLETVDQAAVLAAGPLEDLIADHGDLVINDIERAAKASARFRFVLSGVWPRGQDENRDVWQRVLRAKQPGPDMASVADLPPK